jgi:hypothetical protein
VETATPKERLRALVDALTDEHANLALQLLEGLVEVGPESTLRAAGVIVPKAGSFAEFEPLVVPGPPSSELLIADRR